MSEGGEGGAVVGVVALDGLEHAEQGGHEVRPPPEQDAPLTVQLVGLPVPPATNPKVACWPGASVPL